MWLINKGQDSTRYLARRFKVSHDELTIYIQSKMAEYFELNVELKNEAPAVEVCYTERYFKERYPVEKDYRAAHTLDFYYYMKYPDRFPEKFDHNLFL